MGEGEIKYETHGRIAVVTINRPEAMNALSPAMLTAFDEVFRQFSSDDELWVAVLTGAGDKAFCAGADLKETIPKVTSGGFLEVLGDPTKRYLSDVFKPVIAAVNGHCIAGGLEILQGTDMRVAAEEAMFGVGEVRWGIVPAGGTHIRLPRQIPWAVAMEMILTGRNIGALRAREVGLVNQVVPREKVLDEALRIAELICTNGPVAVRTAKEIAVRALGLEPLFVLESALTPRVLATEDAQEGARAFMEKRQPQFTGQ